MDRTTIYSQLITQPDVRSNLVFFHFLKFLKWGFREKFNYTQNNYSYNLKFTHNVENLMAYKNMPSNKKNIEQRSCNSIL